MLALRTSTAQRARRTSRAAVTASFWLSGLPALARRAAKAGILAIADAAVWTAAVAYRLLAKPGVITSFATIAGIGAVAAGVAAQWGLPFGAITAGVGLLYVGEVRE